MQTGHGWPKLGPSRHAQWADLRRDPLAQRFRLLGRPSSLLFLGDHLLGFLLPFQLLLDEVELLMPLLPELLSQVLGFEQPAHDEGLVLTEEESLEVAL